MVGFNHTDSEYEQAVLLLKQTYGNKNKLIEAHLFAIFDLNITGVTSQSLGKFCSQYESHLRGLKSLCAKIDETGYVYEILLIRKIPNVIPDHINREGQTDFWDLHKLRQAIETEIGHLQATESVDDKYHGKLK